VILRIVVVALGACFGFLLSWGGFTDPDVIQDMLLLKSSYMYVMLATAVAVGFIGTRLARRYLGRAVITKERIAWEIQRPRPEHVWGSVLFGLGWAVSDACPGPVTAQLGQGWGWSVFTAAGMVAGVLLFMWRDAPAQLGEGPSGLVPASAPE
jgi:uncharacterized membrane protein YedE/YeeE